MAETRAQRTLVKSPPELWAEISDLEALARHLGEFGEIHITRLEPETAVAWEGDRARGTVQLEPSGWGTKVTLTAEMPDGGEAADPADAQDASRVAEASPPEPVAEPAAEVVAEPDGGDASEAAEPSESAEQSRRGLFARLFGRRRRQEPAPAAEEPAAQNAVAAEPVVEEATTEQPAAPAEEHAPATEDDDASSEASLDLGRAEAILTEVLDDLGSARHRPFSRLS
jgi:hypothetical protein